MHVDDRGWLVVDEEGFPPAVRVPSVRSTPLERIGVEPRPRGIVWHWTGGPCAGAAYAPALVQEIRGFDREKDRPASWHVLIAKDGRIFQSIDFLRGAWHVGRPGVIDGQRFNNINAATIGVELENAGRLLPAEALGFVCSPFWLKPSAAVSIPDPRWRVPITRGVQALDPMTQVLAWWDDFPVAQVDAATRVLAALVTKFGWKREVCSYGHSEFDPTRREDPGPVWRERWLPLVLSRVFG